MPGKVLFPVCGLCSFRLDAVMYTLVGKHTQTNRVLRMQQMDVESFLTYVACTSENTKSVRLELVHSSTVSRKCLSS